MLQSTPSSHLAYKACGLRLLLPATRECRAYLAGEQGAVPAYPSCPSMPSWAAGEAGVEGMEGGAGDEVRILPDNSQCYTIHSSNRATITEGRIKIWN